MTEDSDIRAGRTAVIYARVSTEKQAETNVSVTAQIESGINWCKQNNVTVLKTYTDNGVTGTTLDRDALSDMLGDILTKKPNYLVVYDSSRLTRANELEYFKQVLDIVRSEIIYSGFGGLSANSLAGKMLDAYKGATDKVFVPEQISKTIESMHTKIENGDHVSGPVSFAFEEDIPNMPVGRVSYKDREVERKVDGKIYVKICKATIIMPVEEFFEWVDKGASCEVMAVKLGIGRSTLSNVLHGLNRGEYEDCGIPNRWDEYQRRLELASTSGRRRQFGDLLEPYRKEIRARKRAERMSQRVDATKGRESTENPDKTYATKGEVE